MTSYNIYQKTCPECAATVPADAKRCECGYCFEPVHADAVRSAEEQAAQDEGLFEDYLAARVEQAIEAMRVAQSELAKSPGDFDKALEVMRRLQEVRAARTVLEAQAAKTAEAQKAAAAAKNNLEQTESHAKTSETSVVQSSEPSEAFKALQAAKAAKSMEAKQVTETEECPACHTMFPLGVTRCACGYIFDDRAAKDGAGTSSESRERKDKSQPPIL